MNIHKLRQFACVAEHRSVTKAAEELFVTQQALSKTLQTMQEELGAELFRRSGNEMILTDFGVQILSVAESLLSYHDRCMGMIQELAQKKKRQFTLCLEHVFIQYAIPPALLAYEGMETITAEGIEECLRLVRDGQADLGLCSDPRKAYAEQMDGLRYLQIVSEPVYFLMSRDHPLAQKASITLQDLKDVPQNYPSVNALIMQEYIRSCIAEGFYPKFVFESRDYGLMIRSLAGTDRVQVCASFGLSDLEERKLALVPLQHGSLWTNVGFVMREENMPAAADAFAEEVKNWYGLGTS